jgi:hypothetical protein
MGLNFPKALQSYMDIIQKPCYITCIMLNRLHKTNIKLDFFSLDLENMLTPCKFLFHMARKWYL